MSRYPFEQGHPRSLVSRSGTIIVKGLGFNTLQTTLLQIPYGTFIAIMILIAIYTNHKTHHLGIRVSREPILAALELIPSRSPDLLDGRHYRSHRCWIRNDAMGSRQSGATHWIL